MFNIFFKKWVNKLVLFFLEKKYEQHMLRQQNV